MRTYTFPTRPGWDPLAAKIAQLFDVPATALALTYTDDDGDEITMSSDEELQQYYLGLEGTQPIKFAVTALPSADGKVPLGKASLDKGPAPTMASVPPLPASHPGALPNEEPEMVAWARSQLREAGLDEQSEDRALGAFNNMLRMLPGRRRHWGWGHCGPPGWRRRMFEPPPGDFMGFGYRQPQFPPQHWANSEYEDAYSQPVPAPPPVSQQPAPSATATAIVAESSDAEMEMEPVAGPSRPSSTVNTAAPPRTSTPSPQTGSDEDFAGIPPFPGAPSRIEGGPQHGRRRRRSPSPEHSDVSGGWQGGHNSRVRHEHHEHEHRHRGRGHHGHHGHRVPHEPPIGYHGPPPPGPFGMPPPPPPPYPHPHHRGGGPPLPNFPGGPGSFW
jgi:hypothetical protein